LVTAIAVCHRHITSPCCSGLHAFARLALRSPYPVNITLTVQHERTMVRRPSLTSCVSRKPSTSLRGLIETMGRGHSNFQAVCPPHRQRSTIRSDDAAYTPTQTCYIEGTIASILDQTPCRRLHGLPISCGLVKAKVMCRSLTRKSSVLRAIDIIARIS